MSKIYLIIKLLLATTAMIFLLNSKLVHAQTERSYKPLIEMISEFEGNRDPKCAATANRLEDFMYGTPLMDEARIEKSILQKKLIKRIWLDCSANIDATNQKKISEAVLQNELNKLLILTEQHTSIFTVKSSTGVAVEIAKRDLKHYSSVAYAYRAILAVQQDALFEDLKILPFEPPAMDLLKKYLDVSTLAVLQLSDEQSRKLNEPEISAASFAKAWNKLLISSKGNEISIDPVVGNTDLTEQLELVSSIIRSKQKSFEKYNNISMFVFQRNAQVYFSRHAWPKDETENRNFRILYNETLIQFVKDLWKQGEVFATAKGNPLIRQEDIDAAIDTYLPYKANQLEDITFFPKLARIKQVDVEAYDLDAFRDGGAHWTYIEMALSDSSFQPKLSADPFALEVLSEAVAHLGVLSLRLAGVVAKDEGHERLTVGDLMAGLNTIQDRVIEGGTLTSASKDNKIVSSVTKENADVSVYFTEVTESSNVIFNQRSSDWLSRFIRSYSVDSTQGIIKTAIPPAFGGAGVGAEDMNNDGYPDLLLLSGLGNAIYLNNGDGTFYDHTVKSRISWDRVEDHMPGEPRQPIIADFDNDGLQDIFISYVNDEHHIYRNIGDAIYESRTKSAGLGGLGTVGGPCTALDFDGDGLLDIYIGYFGDYLKGIHPTLARKNKNGLPNKLFRNLGNFKFEEVINSGAEDQGWSQSIGHADINGDNLQDLIVGNDFGTNTYYLNLGNGKFKDASFELGTDKPSFTMNVGITDLNRDHLPDFYISNIVVMEKDEKYIRPEAESAMKFNPDVMANLRVVEANDLFLSSVDKEIGVTYDLSKNITRGFSSTGWSWDADFFDYDNDGDQDLYCLTGMNDFLVYSVENPYYQDEEGVGRNVFFADSKREANVFFENEGGLLVANEMESGLDVVYNSRSAAYLDMDMDGDEDIVINNYHDNAILFNNNAEINKNNWIKVKLIGDPYQSITRDAIGAKIIVTAKDLDVWTEIHSTTGYLSCHPKEQHIGIGKANEVSVKVIWPNGVEQSFKKVTSGKQYVVEFGKEIRVRDS